MRNDLEGHDPPFQEAASCENILLQLNCEPHPSSELHTTPCLYDPLNNAARSLERILVNEAYRSSKFSPSNVTNTS